MKIGLFFLLLSINLGYCQGKNVVISYGLQIEKEQGLFENNSTLKSFFEKSIIDAKKLTFHLIISENGSKFYKEGILDDDIAINSQRFTLAMANYLGIVINLKDKILFQKEILGDNIYGEESLKSNWILTNETKLIDNYLCYKATNIFTVNNGEKIFNHPVIAWYCPKLPYPYGPIGYGNLPGLILELQVRNVVYGAKSIQINSNLRFDIKSLDKIKVLNEKELEAAYNNLNDF